MLWVLRGERLRPPPIWLMRQAGRYLPEYRDLRAQAKNFLEFCYSPALAVEATMQPIRRFDLDAAIIFSDILVVPHALGRAVEFREGEGPVLEPFEPGQTVSFDPEALKQHLAPVYEAIVQTRRELAKNKALIGFAGAPWTLACYMIDGRNRNDGFAATRRFMRERPDEFAALIDTLGEAVLAHCRHQLAAGAQVIQLFDSWAGLLVDEGLEALKRWSVTPMRRIAEVLAHETSGVPVIAFPRGVGQNLELYALDRSFAAISVDDTVSSEWARDHVQKRMAVQGHLSNQTLLEGGERLQREVEAMTRTLGRGPYIFNLAHGVLPQTPPEHVTELIRLIRGPRWGKV
ncbi:MAG: uroporphyrinogen decarboxylase [Reyranellaceae bacterium]